MNRFDDINKPPLDLPLIRGRKQSPPPLEKREGLGVSVYIALVVFLCSLFLADTLLHSKNMFDVTPVRVQIPENSSAKEIGQLLFLSGISDRPSSFLVAAKLLNLDPRLKAGNYYFSPSMTNYSILMRLSQGKVQAGEVRLTVPEGSSIYRISKILASSGVRLDRPFNEEALKLSGDRLKQSHIFLTSNTTRSLEGYLFPDTYFISANMKTQDLVSMMLGRFEEVVLPVWRSSRIKKYTLHQVLTMASIVEKEAETDLERPIIASVFYNRLESGMALRADPTVKYAIPNPTKRVTYSDLKYPSPYNTYLNKGLPPGPICNPGLKSILAAIHPAKTNYIYFVSNGDGTHTFSVDWQGQEREVKKFRNLSK